MTIHPGLEDESLIGAFPVWKNGAGSELPGVH
jgi:hypothetical protein